MFRDSIEAFLYVVEGGSGIKEVKAETGYMRNGIRHCRVQVECKDGAEYGIDAYGEEADRLLAQAKRYMTKIEVMVEA
ncbi:hypothetical protein [Candidatus Nitrososphaera sp. FF02]|uniref:hypothetical protein n=1 Tax=Candidatus Nitrososphaera sp. FF02 TaxID=3398226 RepID=UPI0039ED2DD4